MQFTSYSTKIKNLSLVCAIFVVSIHLPIPAVKNGFSYSCWSIVQGMASIAVPFFFLFSGYFLSAHFDEEGWWGREIGKRIKTILVPYVIWSSIALVNREVACLIRNSLLGAQADYTVNVFRWFGLDFTCMPGAYPLWYLRNLMLLVLASFLVKKYIDSFRWGGVFVLFGGSPIFQA